MSSRCFECSSMTCRLATRWDRGWTSWVWRRGRWAPSRARSRASVCWPSWGSWAWRSIGCWLASMLALWLFFCQLTMIVTRELYVGRFNWMGVVLFFIFSFGIPVPRNRPFLHSFIWHVFFSLRPLFFFFFESKSLCEYNIRWNNIYIYSDRVKFLVLESLDSS